MKIVGEMGTASSDGATVYAYEVKRVRDAQGALCLVCGAVWGEGFEGWYAWHFRKSQAMHEKGTGHKTAMFLLGR